MNARAPEPQDWLSALDRLVHRHKLLTLDQARLAGRLITGDDSFQFPPPAPPAPANGAAPPEAAPTPAAEPAPDAAAPPAADDPSPDGSEKL